MVTSRQIMMTTGSTMMLLVSGEGGLTVSRMRAVDTLQWEGGGGRADGELDEGSKGEGEREGILSGIRVVDTLRSGIRAAGTLLLCKTPLTDVHTYGRRSYPGQVCSPSHPDIADSHDLVSNRIQEGSKHSRDFQLCMHGDASSVGKTTRAGTCVHAGHKQAMMTCRRDTLLTFLARYPSSQSVSAATMKMTAHVRGLYFHSHSHSPSSTGTSARRMKVMMLGMFMIFSGT